MDGVDAAFDGMAAAGDTVALTSPLFASYHLSISPTYNLGSDPFSPPPHSLPPVTTHPTTLPQIKLTTYPPPFSHPPERPQLLPPLP